MNRLAILAISCAMASTAAVAQVQETSSWRFGFTGGAHASKMYISDINKDLFPTNKAIFSGMGSVYFQKSFGREMNFAIRPEIAILSRGGKITDIMRNKLNYYQDNGYSDIIYKVKANYVDLRLPLMYRFGTTRSHIRPYIYIAPIFGLSTGGKLTRELQKGADGSDQLNIDATKANLNPVYFSGAFGLGFDWLFNVGNHVCTLGLEAMYEHGFTNTFGNDATAENRLPISMDPTNLVTMSDRRFSGVELKLTLGIPFSIFGSTTKKTITDTDDDGPEIEEAFFDDDLESESSVGDRDCLSLDEIMQLMADGQSVYGKVICDIDGAVEFNSSDSSILPESYGYLDRVAEVLIRTNAPVKVIGHTDSTGSDELNMNLSRERAISVVNYLKGKGVSASKISYDYFGESRPIDTNATPEGRRHNRRVEFELLKD